MLLSNPLAELALELLISAFAIAIPLLILYSFLARSLRVPTIPVSVNYHFTRKCNYSCGFCFHTAKSSHVLPIEDAKRGLFLLKKAGMRKLNFAGGEPLLYPKFLEELILYSKQELKLESISIVTNGSRLTDRFLSKVGQYIDIIAVSCDSFCEETNVEIGRGTGAHLEQVRNAASLCRKYGVKFKLNTVVNRYNFEEDMNPFIEELQPFRWKCFQVLVVEEENGSDTTLRNATRFTISDAEFDQFCQRHSHQKCFVPESNKIMKSSYLILDEWMRFLNKGVGQPSPSILEVGVERALARVEWDTASFSARGGVYDWSRSGNEHESIHESKELEW